MEFYVDIHAHSTLTNGTHNSESFLCSFNISKGFMYGNVYDEEKRFESHAIFPKLLCQKAHDFSWVRNELKQSYNNHSNILIG